MICGKQSRHEKKTNISVFNNWAYKFTEKPQEEVNLSLLKNGWDITFLHMNTHISKAKYQSHLV